MQLVHLLQAHGGSSGSSVLQVLEVQLMGLAAFSGTGAEVTLALPTTPAACMVKRLMDMPLEVGVGVGVGVCGGQL